MRLVKAINGKLEADTGGRHLSYVCETTTEVAGLREVLLAQFVFLDLRSTLKNLLSFGTTDGDVDSDRLITAMFSLAVLAANTALHRPRP